MNERFRDAIGHEFADPRLLRQALTHPSASGRAGGGRDFERLEFLGDRVLALIVAEALLARFPDIDEGALSERLAAQVRRETLAEVALRIGLGEALARAPDDGPNRRRAAATSAADACEAVIAALFLDGGLEAARRFVLRHWQPLLERAPEARPDARTRLQHWSQARALGLPAYTALSRSGPAHRPEFEVEARLSNGESACGRGGSKQAAAQAAAAALLARLE